MSAAGPEVEGFSLSPQQRHLWRVQQDAGAAAFAAQCAVEIEGPLDEARLQAALARTVERHEILRTTYPCLAGMSIPVQAIGEPAALALHRADDADLDAAMARARAAAHADAAPLRADLLRGAERSVLLLTTPALGADAQGIANLVRDVARTYAAGNGGPELDDEPMQYADLAQWQNELLEEPEAQDAFRVDAAAMAVALPGREDGDAAFAPRCAVRCLDAALADGVRAFAAERGVSEAAFLLACWQVLLARLSGRTEIVVGVTGDGRSYEGLDVALGLLARALPVAGSVDPERPFAAVVAALETAGDDGEGALVAALDAQEHFAFERQAAAPPDAFFPLGFAAEERGGSFDAGGGVRFAVKRQHACTDRFELRLVAARGPEGLALELWFDVGRYAATAVERWLAHLETLIAAALRDPEAAVGELELLDAEERRRVLTELNPPAFTAAETRCVHELVEAHIDRDPDGVAVVSSAGPLTRAELERASNRVAHRLRALGVQPDDLVGLCVERSAAMVVGILGILKAGAAYLPLDPGYPAERLAFMLADSDVRVLVTRGGLVDRLPRTAAAVVDLDDTAALAAASAERPDAAATAANLAYVIYTSGSTGKPKGVEIPHACLVTSTTAREDVYDEQPGRYLLLSSFAFDSSVAGLFWTLCTGGTLVLPEEGAERDLHAITAAIEEQAVTHTLALPSLWGLVLRETDPAKLRSLRCVIVAGEACSRELVELQAERLPAAALYNEYGPTEATVWSTVHRCTAAEPARKVPIGRPLRHAAIHLLDPRRQPVPIGVPGELYIGGAALARGYRGRPELTAERFVDNPFGAGRLYRTGDLARYRDDGAIEFLGRVDFQVKIRGYRVELEEIEEALRGSIGVGDAAVAAREDTPGDARLVGYVVPAAGAAAPSAADLQAQLGATLPEYMVPAAFVVLDALPLSPNGKVDRAALPAPDAGAAGRAPYVAPRDAVEEVLAQIWSEVLGVDEVGLDDSFFQLGGHSLLVTQMVFRVRDTLGIELPLRAVFEAVTLGGLADRINADPQQRATAARAAQLLAQLADLSEEEVDAMLREAGPAPDAGTR